MTLEFDLTDALSMRERLGCPTLAAAHAGTALRERLETLTDDWEAARARRDLIDAQIRALRGEQHRDQHGLDSPKQS